MKYFVIPKEPFVHLKMFKMVVMYYISESDLICRFE